MIVSPSQSKVASKIPKLPATQPLWLDDITKAHFPQESGKPSGEVSDEVVKHDWRPFTAGWLPQMVVDCKGICANMSEEFRFRNDKNLRCNLDGCYKLIHK